MARHFILPGRHAWQRTRLAFVASCWSFIRQQQSWPLLVASPGGQSHVAPSSARAPTTAQGQCSRRRAALGTALMCSVGFLAPHHARASASACSDSGASTCKSSDTLSRQKGMLAVVYSGQGEGGMEFREAVPVPEVQPSQVLLRVHAAAINPVDYKTPTIPLANKILAPEGSIVGIDVSGTIVKKGSEVSGFAVGDEVFGFAKGSLGEFAICDAEKVALKPTALSHARAAALPTAALTSYQALRDNGLQSGDELLVLGASGGCGLAGVAIGKALGARVTGVCSARNAVLVQSMGADDVVDYTQGDNALDKLADFDLVLDTVTGSGAASDPNYETRLRSALKPGRPYVALNSGAGDWLRLLVSKVTGWRRFFQRAAYDLVLTDQNGKDLAVLAEWAASGKLPLPIDTTFNFDASSVQQAFAKLQSRRTVGKLVFQITT